MLLERARGKGGGSPDLVQIAPADAGAARDAFDAARAAFEHKTGRPAGSR